MSEQEPIQQPQQPYEEEQGPTLHQEPSPPASESTPEDPYQQDQASKPEPPPEGGTMPEGDIPAEEQAPEGGQPSDLSAGEADSTVSAPNFTPQPDRAEKGKETPL